MLEKQKQSNSWLTACKRGILLLLVLALTGCVPLVGTLEAGVETTQGPEVVLVQTPIPTEAEAAPVPVSPDLGKLGSPPHGILLGGFGADSLVQVGEAGELTVLPVPGQVSLSPDSRLGAYVTEGDIWIYDLANGQRRNLTNTPDRLETSPVWSAANPNLVIFLAPPVGAEGIPYAGMLATVNLDGSDYRVLESAGSTSQPAPSPDGRHLAYDLEDSAWLYKLGENRELFDVTLYGLSLGKDMRISSPAWSPDGQRIAWWVYGVFPGSSDPRWAVVVFDLPTRTHRVLHPYAPISMEGTLAAPAWSPDGKWLAFETRGEVHRTDLWVIEVDGSQELSLGWSSTPTWQPRGEALAFMQWGDEQGPFDASRVAYVETGQWIPRLLDLPRNTQLNAWRAPLPAVESSGAAVAPLVWFGLQPSIASAQQAFPSGTSQVYAMWSYTGMTGANTVKVTLNKDGAAWQEQELPWDEARFGAAGIMREWMLGSADQPLEAGNYHLSLALDGVEVIIDPALASFSVAAAAGIEPLLSPDGAWTAEVKTDRLVVRDNSGVDREVEAAEISALAWMPDSVHLLYNVRDRSGQDPNNPLMGVADSLWVVDVLSGEKRELASEADNLHSPVVSPDGTYIALIGGMGWQSDCYVASEFWALKLDAQLNLVFSYYQLDFKGLPEASAYVEKIVGWKSPTQVEVAFKWACTDGSYDGIYLLDLTQMTAVKR